MAAKARIPALVAGTGHGFRVHAPALEAAGFEVVGVVGSDVERTQRRAERAGFGHAFGDLDEAIAQTGAAVVTIATPPLTHAPLVRTALARGCHVLCEKPFARDAAEARGLLAEAERAGVIHLLGNQFRLMPERRVIAAAIADGLIGAPRMLTLASYNPLVADPASRMPAWWFDGAKGGGWFGASGSHTIDMVRVWLGEFTSVSAALPSVSQRGSSAEDSFVLRFSIGDGVAGVMQQSGGAWGPPAEMTRVAGTHGTLWLEGTAVWLADASGKRALPVPPEWALPTVAPSSEPGKQFLHLEIPPSIRLFERLHAAIEGDADARGGLATFADGLATMAVIDAARASAARDGARELIGASPAVMVPR